jgi:hypothetical protein
VHGPTGPVQIVLQGFIASTRQSARSENSVGSLLGLHGRPPLVVQVHKNNILIPSPSRSNAPYLSLALWFSRTVALSPARSLSHGGANEAEQATDYNRRNMPGSPDTTQTVRPDTPRDTPLDTPRPTPLVLVPPQPCARPPSPPPFLRCVQADHSAVLSPRFPHHVHSHVIFF